MRYLSGVVMTTLFFSQVRFWELGCLVLGLITFWAPLSDLAHRAPRDIRIIRIGRDVKNSLHFEADCRAAWEYFHG